MPILERISWIVLALIHLMPAVALLAPSLIERLYGVGRGDEHFALFRHRAALFACVFITCVWAAADTAVSQLAVIVAAISMLSFLLLYLRAGSPAYLRSIAVADVIGLPFLGYVGWRAFIAG